MAIIACHLRIKLSAEIPTAVFKELIEMTTYLSIFADEKQVRIPVM